MFDIINTQKGNIIVGSTSQLIHGDSGQRYHKTDFVRDLIKVVCVGLLLT